MKGNHIYNRIKNYASGYQMLDGVKAVVVGVSGGADSVCLLRVLVALRDEMPSIEKFEIRAVHINHCIRGVEADADERFVRDLCIDLGVGFKSYSRDIPAMAREQHLTEEEAGRIFRYECFESEADSLQDYLTEANSLQDDLSEVRIAVAHNKDDLAETVLYNLVRGSSLLGLAGVKPVRGRIIRPLLDTSRVEIEELLAVVNQTYRTDSTNLSTDYTRNKIRHNIIPELKVINDKAVEHIADVAKDALILGVDVRREVSSSKAVKEFSKESVEESGEKSVKDSYNNIINVEVLCKLSALAKGEYILAVLEQVCGRRKDITRDHIESIIRLSNQETGKVVHLPYGMTAERVYETIRVYQRTSVVGQDRPMGCIDTEVIPIEEVQEISKKEYTKMIDYDKINSVLELRKPAPEDYIVINADGGKKKLSRLFTDAKIEKSEREYVPVIADGNEIVWAVGLRLSERYKITEATKSVMIISYKEKSVN